MVFFFSLTICITKPVVQKPLKKKKIKNTFEFNERERERDFILKKKYEKKMNKKKKER